MKRSAATIVREYGLFPDVTNVAGVSYDGTNVWIATGDTLNAMDPASGKTVRALDVPAHAGTAFDGRHLYQISGDRIQKVDPDTGRVVATIPTPEGGASGMAWAEATLWVAQHRKRKIHQVDPETGKILRTIESNRFVTGVTWVDGELWHGTWEGEQSDLRRNRSAKRRGSGAARHAARADRVGVGIERQRHVLLRRRKQRESESRPAAHARLRSQTVEISGMPQSARRALKNVGSWRIRRRQLRVNRVGFAMSAFMSALANCGHLGPPWAR